VQVGLLSEEMSNTPAAVAYLLNMIPFDGADARIGPAPSARVFADPGADPDQPLPSGSPTQYGIYPATLHLVNKALQVRLLRCIPENVLSCCVFLKEFYSVGLAFSAVNVGYLGIFRNVSFILQIIYLIFWVCWHIAVPSSVHRALLGL
jgi:hypothetical protein